MPRLLAPIAMALVATNLSYAAVPSDAVDEENLETVTVLLTDATGAPVEGAEVGLIAIGGKEIAERAAKEGTEWWFPRSHVRSDVKGIGTIRYGDDLDYRCLVARHERRKIMAIANIKAPISGPITLTLRPECPVSGRLECPELVERRGEIRWGIVMVTLDKKRALQFLLDGPSFSLSLPPGDFDIEVRADQTHELTQSIHVDSRESSLNLGTIKLHATNLALLEGKPAPALDRVVSWKNGPATSLAELRGNVVILDFWGYWCGPCVRQMPELFKLHDQYHDHGLEIVGMHVDLGENESDPVDTAAKLDERLTETRKNLWGGRDIPFRVALIHGDRTPYDSKVESLARSSAASAYGIIMYPTQVLIDRQGNVVGEFNSEEASLAALKKALQN